LTRPFCVQPTFNLSETWSSEPISRDFNTRAGSGWNSKTGREMWRTGGDSWSRLNYGTWLRLAEAGWLALRWYIPWIEVTSLLMIAPWFWGIRVKAPSILRRISLWHRTNYVLLLTYSILPASILGPLTDGRLSDLSVRKFEIIIPESGRAAER
jgi:hypothetical protein